MWARVLSVAVGVWLMAAPAVLAYGGVAATNDRIVGPVAASVAIVAVAEVCRPVRHVNQVLGAWLLGAPFLLGYDALAATADSFAAGVLLLVTGGVPGRQRHRYGGGWRAAGERR